MAGLHTFLLSSSFEKLKYVAVTGGAVRIGEVENKRGKLYFTRRSFEVPQIKLPAFFRLIKCVGENLTLAGGVKFLPDGGGKVEKKLSIDAAVSEDLFSKDESSDENAFGRYILLFSRFTTVFTCDLLRIYIRLDGTIEQQYASSRRKHFDLHK